jgi:hypothetical protein
VVAGTGSDVVSKVGVSGALEAEAGLESAVTGRFFSRNFAEFNSGRLSEEL